MIQKHVVTADSAIEIHTYGDPSRSGLLMVPGIMSDAASWSAVARALESWPSVSILNRRGRAPSGPLGDSYSIATEVDDLRHAISAIEEPLAVFGWSYGAVIALMLASEHPMSHLIAYEPVAPEFAVPHLPALRRADEAGDTALSVEIVNRRVSGFGAEYVEGLRGDAETWANLRRLSAPVYAELRALSLAKVDESIGQRAARIDLIIGERNLGEGPYCRAVHGIRRFIPEAMVHVLSDQGHLAHVEAPRALAALVDTLAAL